MLINKTLLKQPEPPAPRRVSFRPLPFLVDIPRLFLYNVKEITIDFFLKIEYNKGITNMLIEREQLNQKNAQSMICS